MGMVDGECQSGRDAVWEKEDGSRGREERWRRGWRVGQRSMVLEGRHSLWRNKQRITHRYLVVHGVVVKGRQERKN